VLKLEVERKRLGIAEACEMDFLNGIVAFAKVCLFLDF
jgi:hypothetical protein